jgi:RING finger protein 121
MCSYIFLFTVIFAQSALVHWRKAHRRSYELVTLIGLWLVPPIFSIFGQFWRFLFVSCES